MMICAYAHTCLDNIRLAVLAFYLAEVHFNAIFVYL